MIKQRWGIIGLGNIANKFAEALREFSEAQLIAVASRDSSRSEVFAYKHKADRYYGAYEDLIQDPEVDVVYIATPHTTHAELSKLCLEHDKHVLCEKPFAMNEREAQEVYDLAAEKGKFILEALWTRFLPTYKKVRSLIDDNAMGKIKSISSDFGFKSKFDPSSRLFDPKLGGGSILDVGIYPIFYAVSLLGEPKNIKAIASFGVTKVDESCAMIFEYADGVLAQLFSSIISNNTQETSIHGDVSRLLINHPSHGLTTLNISQDWKPRGLVKVKTAGNGFNYQIEEVMNCLAQGLTNSPLWTSENSLALHRTIDRVRQEAGIIYPQDK